MISMSEPGIVIMRNLKWPSYGFGQFIKGKPIFVTHVNFRAISANSCKQCKMLTNMINALLRSPSDVC